jgi:ribosomal protein S15P/S13E
MSETEEILAEEIKKLMEKLKENPKDEHTAHELYVKSKTYLAKVTHRRAS